MNVIKCQWHFDSEAEKKKSAGEGTQGGAVAVVSSSSAAITHLGIGGFGCQRGVLAFGRRARDDGAVPLQVVLS